MHMKQFSAQLLDDHKHELAESPFYDPRFRRYSWVDITKGEFWTRQDGEKPALRSVSPSAQPFPWLTKTAISSPPWTDCMFIKVAKPNCFSR